MREGWSLLPKVSNFELPWKLTDGPAHDFAAAAVRRALNFRAGQPPLSVVLAPAQRGHGGPQAPQNQEQDFLLVLLGCTPLAHRITSPLSDLLPRMVTPVLPAPADSSPNKCALCFWLSRKPKASSSAEGMLAEALHPTKMPRLCLQRDLPLSPFLIPSTSATLLATLQSLSPNPLSTNSPACRS